MKKAGEGMGRQDAHQQPRAGAGIAEIEHVVRLGEAADADAVDAPGAIAAARDRRRPARAAPRRCAARPRLRAGRVIRSGRPRARRTSARGARSTCRRARGPCRASGALGRAAVSGEARRVETDGPWRAAASKSGVGGCAGGAVGPYAQTVGRAAADASGGFAFDRLRAVAMARRPTRRSHNR